MSECLLGIRAQRYSNGGALTLCFQMSDGTIGKRRHSKA